MPLAILLILFAAGWRVIAAHQPNLANFAPLMALTFCGAVYFRDKRMWLVPFVALLASDLYLDRYYASVFHETWTWPSVAIRAVCFALALVVGWVVAHRKNWLTLLAGSLSGSLVFYFITNTDAWLRDPYYVKTAAGWWQAMTIGRPEFPPTLFFFRNTFVSDLLFVAMFAISMEYAALRTGQPSLIAKPAKA